MAQPPGALLVFEAPLNKSVAYFYCPPCIRELCDSTDSEQHYDLKKKIDNTFRCWWEIIYTPVTSIQPLRNILRVHWNPSYRLESRRDNLYQRCADWNAFDSITERTESPRIEKMKTIGKEEEISSIGLLEIKEQLVKMSPSEWNNPVADKNRALRETRHIELQVKWKEKQNKFLKLLRKYQRWITPPEIRDGDSNLILFSFREMKLLACSPFAPYSPRTRHHSIELCRLISLWLVMHLTIGTFSSSFSSFRNRGQRHTRCLNFTFHASSLRKCFWANNSIIEWIVNSF